MYSVCLLLCLQTSLFSVSTLKCLCGNLISLQPVGAQRDRLFDPVPLWYQVIEEIHGHGTLFKTGCKSLVIGHKSVHVRARRSQTGYKTSALRRKAQRCVHKCFPKEFPQQKHVYELRECRLIRRHVDRQASVFHSTASVVNSSRTEVKMKDFNFNFDNNNSSSSSHKNVRLLPVTLIGLMRAVRLRHLFYEEPELAAGSGSQLRPAAARRSSMSLAETLLRLIQREIMGPATPNPLKSRSGARQQAGREGGPVEHGVDQVAKEVASHFLRR
ncbi:uncharacterized protein V6R79_025337 [Siganus canaliculatus]